MKAFHTLLGLLLFLSYGYGQSARYSGYASATFEGIKTEDGNLYYTTYRGQAVTDTLYSYVIEVFDSGLQRTAKERVPTKYNSEVVDVEGHNGGLLFYIQSSSDALIYYYNAQGKKEWQKTVELDKNKFTNAEMRSLGDKGVVIVRPDKEKKDGFRVTLFDNQMNQKWTQAQFPEKGDITYEKVRVAGDKIGVLTSYQKSMFSTKFEKSLYVFSATDGSLVYQQIVGNEENEQYPEDFAMNADGSAFVIGYTYGSDREVKSMFYTEYSPAGKQNYLQKFSMEDDLAPKLASERADRHFGLNQPPLINIENIRKTANGYQVIGEKYNYVPEPIQTPQNGVTVGTSGKGKLYVMDYAVLDISGTGKLEEVKNIGKPHKLINAEGHLVEKQVYADDYYEKFDLYSYRYMTDKEGTPTMVSLNWHRNTPYIGFTSLEASHENILNRIYLDKQVSEREGGEVTNYLFKKEGAQVPLETYHYNVLPYNKPGKMLFYDYEGGELAMQVMDMEVKMPEPEKAELQLRGIPGRQFQGLMPIEGEGYYTFYLSETAEGENNLYVYHRFDKALHTTGRSVLQVPRQAYFAGNISNGTGQVIVFQSARERAWYFYGLDASGKLIATNRIALSETANQVPTGNLLLEPAPDGFYMVQPFVDTATERNGYEVIRLNPDQQVRWNWSHMADSNEVLQLTSTGGGNGIFAIIHNQHHYRDYKQVSNSLMAIDDKTGKLLFEHDLYDGQDAGFPQYVKIGKDKSVVTSGMYFKGRDFNTTNSEGLFFLKLSADGKKTFYTKTPWEKVEASIKKGTETDFLISGKTKVLIEDMVLMPDGS